MIIEIIKNFVVGLGLGIFFAFAKLPLPAPAYVPAVFAILGITMGYLFMQNFK